jgi:hypothetical protein
MRAVAVAAALLLLAGCLGDGPDPAAAPLDARFTFRPPVSIAGGATGEAFLAVGPGGLALACTHGGFTVPSPTWVSRDDGATWDVLDPGATIPSGDCDVEVRADGAWFVLYDTVWGAALSVSRDGGATWTHHPDIALPVTGVVDRPWLGLAGDRLLLSYKGIGQGPGIVVVSASDDDGATWSPPRPVSLVSDPTHANHIGFDFLVGADGVVRIPLVKYDNDPTVDEPFSFLVSRDRGDSWSEEPALPPRDADVLVGAAVAGDGTTLYWAWHDDAGRLLATASTDDGRTWGEPALVAAGQFVYTPALAGHADGTATLAWVQTGPSLAAAARLDARQPGLVTATAILEGPTAVAQSAEFLDVAVGPDGGARIAYAWNDPAGSCEDLLRPLNRSCLHFVREG